MSLIKLTRDINKPLHSRRDINIIYQDKALSDQTLARAKVCMCVIRISSIFSINVLLLAKNNHIKNRAL